MADKMLTYVVHRAMHADGVDYARGDEREMRAVDAAPLVAAGALALKGEVPVVRDEPVRHTFGQAPAEHGAGLALSAGSPDVSDSRIEGRRSPAKRGG
jgi:hypothetical protein